MVEKFKRTDGRKLDEPREIKSQIGVIKNADGSALFSFGDSIAIAAVYGPKVLHPQHMQNPQKGLLRCYYDMAPFSVNDRKKPGPNRRSSEISNAITNALLPVLDLDAFPNAAVDCFITIIQADASTRCAAINAASMALAHAGLPMKELVSGTSVGKLGDTLVVDLSKEEEDYEIKDKSAATDIATAFLSKSNRNSLLQIDGDITPKEMLEAIKLAEKACQKITDIQIKTLKSIKE